MKFKRFSLPLLALMPGLFSVTANAQVPGAPPAALPSAQEIADLAVRYVNALSANREVLKTYSWQYRTEVWKDGQLQWVDLVNANLNAQGLPIFTQINREQTAPQKNGIFSKPEQTKEFEQMDRIINYVTEWIVWYNRMPLSRATELFDQAVRNNAVNMAHPSGKLIQVSGRNIRDSNANDSVSLWLVPENGHPVQFSFTIPVVKSLDGATGETIQATMNFRYLRNGEAFYADHVEVSIPSRNMRIKIENLNMQKKL